MPKDETSLKERLNRALEEARKDVREGRAIIT
jgi:hypothetical protein